ncbi:hypothetical protein LTR97_008757 [Elasticomyces elasticus]|uniref:BTB domain-containing protein n=1 Tax=Elasticomyces elasticus TaxID=574655 RepID=A0AAN7ZM90_9PEZI|nr:hypothetical protein LTR97_008757 [Elasticomyces elasticus]
MTSSNKRSMEGNDSERSPKRTKLEYTNAFTVLVGAEEEEFLLHASIAVMHSKFFRAACNGGFKEAKDKIIRMAEVEPATFRSYLQWLYSRDVVVLTAAELATDVKDESLVSRLVKLYLLADVLADTLLRNRIIDEIQLSLGKNNTCLGIGHINWAYESTPATSTLRKLIVDDHVRNSSWYASWLETARPSLPADFFADLAIGIAKTNWKQPIRPRDAGRCTYHEHDDEFPSCVD